MEEDSEFSVVRYTEDRIGDVRRLWGRQYDADAVKTREALFHWVVEENPFLEGESPYFLLLHGKDVVGMHGYMPLKFSVYGVGKTVYFAHDILIHPDYRGKGIGKIFLNRIMHMMPSLSGALWFNEPNFRLYSKCGWLEVKDIYPFVKILDTRGFLIRKTHNRTLGGVAAKSMDLLERVHSFVRSRNCQERIVVEKISAFDCAFDAFYEAIRKEYKVIVWKGSEYLNWKFVRKPLNAYTRYAALGSNGDLCGYLVSKSEPSVIGSRTKVVDVLVNPRRKEAFLALLRSCIDDHRLLGNEYVEILVTDQRWIGLLKREWFLRSRKPQRFMVQGEETEKESLKLTSRRTWYLTNSDGDGDSWDP